MRRIYLDHAATTPVNPHVAQHMRDFELQHFGNPSSSHREGQNARAKIDFARAAVGKFLNAKPQEIVFTSGATEANNLATQGVINYAVQKNKSKPHVVTTQLEHQSVYNTVKELEKRGVIEATFVKPDKNGKIRPDQILKAVKKNTELVSVIFVSNEIGTILPIREIGQSIKGLKPIFHVDAVQAAQFYNCNVEKLGCDLLTLSAHKIYGPKGIGALYIKSGLKLANLTFGGSQEYGKRPGTQNTAGIMGFAKAIELLGPLENRQDQARKISTLRDLLIDNALRIKNVELNGPTGEERAANNASLTVYGVDQDALMTALDLAGIAASTGSACVSGSSVPSHVIEALGKIGQADAATIRLTLGQNTKPSEIKSAVNILTKIIKQLRR
ncbi:MAG: hypothetical protein A3J07_02670 [Candidatus Doudnabacteria bacterium RIFCSPLOWO2_02_FULL_49_13]|uniref:cysteine desulfurase n=1 Tax=Candidatus Doudnabacteria bacterium RIFCSPHIGHO2_12_FULL_48_16 TaxID=1817838 RepID=A0A1F5PLP5_9BACT|nr:MAG: hypothetical protein A3B77_01315 [Candidatus Doudnabacteria bacterium RIFCSPHIGHO2_02_FULL_49_24]OGE90582.1 MAG: hypothetical protein A3E29_02185 [Candidatus Doudnabacteria bacterium RIFCSPHIGHO2_12_FULL_48_16]OGE97619.1 MAG: hypothetical protein A2990_03240 [Candidatus Doudnabacteria bacterium RIFCSPLOWO2_01_FULL_49_40]OGF02974.1 MAG: hypothetical protein A3J07_02670 [Candidatus Doudnabacteria bacterium RIFCSPLOWO2_02_FULL_49_13]